MTNSLFTQFYHLRGSRIAKDLNPQISTRGSAVSCQGGGSLRDWYRPNLSAVELRENDPKSLANHLRNVASLQKSLSWVARWLCKAFNKHKESEVAEVSQYIQVSAEWENERRACLYHCVPFETRKAEQPRFHKVLIISLLNDAMVSVHHNAMIVTGLLLASLAASEPQSEAPK